MKNKRGLFLTIILVGLLAFSSCAWISTQLKLNKAFQNAGINFEDKESILKLEKDPGLFWLWCDWRPIEHLMTKEEKKLVKKISKIQDAEERNFYQEKFTEFFWKRRDTNLYDDENEFKDAIYSRVTEAQTRFGRKEDNYRRKCAHGIGWETDMGLMYILLGETPYPIERQDVKSLLSFSGGSYQESALLPQEIEVWFYDAPDDFYSWLSEGGVVWLLFEKDSSGYWQWGERTIGLFYSYQNYMESLFNPGASITYTAYIGEVYKFIQAVAESYIYDEDLEFEDMLVEWVKVEKK